MLPNPEFHVCQLLFRILTWGWNNYIAVVHLSLSSNKYKYSVQPGYIVGDIQDLSLSGRKLSVEKCSEVEWSVVKVLVTGCLTLLEDI